MWIGRCVLPGPPIASGGLVPAPKRGEMLYRTGELLLKHKERLARDMTREMGKVLSETRGDVQEAADTAFYMAGEGRRFFGQTTPSRVAGQICDVRAHAGGSGGDDCAVEFSHGDSLAGSCFRRWFPGTLV